MAKQLSLNLESKENENIKLLHKSDENERRKIFDMLQYQTVDRLQSLAAPFLRLIKKYRFRYTDEEGTLVEPEIITLFRKSKSQPKKLWINLLVLFFDEHNYPIIFDDMPKCEIELWREVLRNHFLEKEEVDKVMGTDCFTDSRWSFGHADLKKPLNQFFHDTRIDGQLGEFGRYRERTTVISVIYPRVTMLLKEFFPDLFEFKEIQTLPLDVNLKTYSGESLVFTKLPVLSSLYDNGMMSKELTKLTGGAVKKMQKVLSLPDFFQTYPDSKQPQLSTALMTNFYLFYRVSKGRAKQPSSPEKLLKEIIEGKCKVNDYTLPVCLPYIKGIKKNLISTYNIDYIIESALSIFKTYHAKGWLPVDSLMMNIRTLNSDTDSRIALFSSSDLDRMGARNGYADDRYIHLGNMVRQLFEPFVKSLMFMLSTFGIVEIAYREPAEGDTSYFDGLQYVRLTELGKYVLGITQNYTAQATVDNEPSFELDSQRLIIKVLRQDSPFVSLLSDFADHIAPTLYRVTYDSFLTSCFSRNDVERKVAMFRQYICAEPPAVWIQFFESVIARCNPFLPVNDKFKILRLPSDDHDLQRLVLTEPSVMKYVLKADNYMLLIKESDMKQFSNALRKFGYLL